ncbi:hypothetical protein GMRT_10576 [Giardia muris]|uniref:Uncharacterized protein n=1 Tax=Giardia muris TaxID=5742 RepID=A0A4Z1SPP7_GIAMU|nr:hypothetical protein GMRT_10576 [Giardia muris]|eukprot:TNJ26845.1 hypothetical protein GMRT_10576 [Giardia muris]
MNSIPAPQLTPTLCARLRQDPKLARLLRSEELRKHVCEILDAPDDSARERLLAAAGARYASFRELRDLLLRLVAAERPHKYYFES